LTSGNIGTQKLLGLTIVSAATHLYLSKSCLDRTQEYHTIDALNCFTSLLLMFI